MGVFADTYKHTHTRAAAPPFVGPICLHVTAVNIAKTKPVYYVQRPFCYLVSRVGPVAETVGSVVPHSLARGNVDVSSHRWRKGFLPYTSIVVLYSGKCTLAHMRA